MQNQIEQFNQDFINIWNLLPNSTPNIEAEFSIEAQNRRQLYIDQVLTKLKKVSKLNPKITEVPMQKSKKSIGALLKLLFDFSDQEIGALVNDDFTKCTFKFIEMAEQFDEKLPKAEIFQAMRNYWIINTLQLLFNKTAEVTPSLFAYSMLYPYSDNLLDDESISKSDKIEFCNKFRKWLKGKSATPTSYTETKVYELVQLIEQDWERSRYPELYESLIAIHDAQFKSIRLQTENIQPTDRLLLEICFEKGGTSVLADGYLILGKLNKSQQTFCYGFGIYLQLIDDLQDVREDLNDHIDTYLNAQVAENKMAEVINKTFHFLEVVLAEIDRLGDQSELATNIKSVIRKSVQFMVFDFMAENQHLFSRSYLAHYESKSTVSFSYLEKRRAQSAQNKYSFMDQIEKAYAARKINKLSKKYA